MYDPNNPNNLINCKNNCYMFCHIVLFLILICGCYITLYFIGVYTTFGIVIAKNPTNNRTTGCPQGMQNCEEKDRLFCYKNNMINCYIAGIVTWLLWPLTFGFLAIVIYFIYFMIKSIRLFTHTYINASNIVAAQEAATVADNIDNNNNLVDLEQ